MAVADVAVTMGPRNRRRLTTGAVVIAVLAAAVAALAFLLPSSNHSGAGSSAGHTGIPAPTFVTDRIVYGMNKTDVARRIGHPTKTVGPCWQYDENEKIRNGENFLNAQRVCFLGDVYSYDYSEIDGTWNYPTDPIELPHPVG